MALVFVTTLKKKAQEKIDQDALADRKSIETQSSGVCERMSKCNTKEKVLEFFECYSGIVSDIEVIFLSIL